MRRCSCLWLLIPSVAAAQAVPTGATDPVNSLGIAHGAVIWIHPTDVTQSLVVTANDGAGVSTYGLDGHVVQMASPDVTPSVDLRYGLSFDGGALDVLAVADQTLGGLAFFSMNPALRSFGAMGSFATIGVTPAAVALYEDGSGVLYAFVGGTNGAVVQYAVAFNASGPPSGTAVRTLNVPTTVEAALADDLHGALYVTEPTAGIWRFAALADAGTAGALIDSTISPGHLTNPVQDLALYEEASGDGYVLASNAGASTYAVYDRLSNAYMTQFSLDAGNGFDAPRQTRGIAVTNLPLNANYPQGLFVAQDPVNPTGSDFKYVPWNAIAGPAVLVIDPTFNPRGGTLSADGGPGTDAGTGPSGGTGPKPQGDINPTPRGCGCGQASSLAALLGLLLALERLIWRSKPR